MTFEEKLLKLYKKKSHSQESLAEAIGVSRSTIQEYLEGDSKPKLNIARKLAKEFGVSLDYLFLGDEYISNDTGEDISPDSLDTDIYKRLYDLYANASKETVLQAEAFMDFLLTQNAPCKENKIKA